MKKGKQKKLSTEEIASLTVPPSEKASVTKKTPFIFSSTPDKKIETSEPAQFSKKTTSISAPSDDPSNQLAMPPSTPSISTPKHKKKDNTPQWRQASYPTRTSETESTSKVRPPSALTPQSVIQPIPNIPGLSLLSLEFVQDIFERRDDIEKSKAHMALLKDAHKEEIIDDDEILAMYETLIKVSLNKHPCFRDLEKIAKKILKQRKA